MGRIFSLRGKIGLVDNQSTVNHLVFDYVSPDRRRAWRILYAHIWPVDIIAINADDGFLCFQAALATDTGKFNQPNLSDPTENRFCAWAQQTYNTRDGHTNFITPNGVALNDMRFLCDPDTMITKEVYLNVANTSDIDSNKYRDWGYMVVLEEIKVTPVESLYQQIKGMGQDLGPT